MALQHQGGSPTYRPFEKKDLEVAAELFYQQWGTEAGERLGRLDAQVNLCNYLMDADWGLVAEGAGGELLGVLLAETGSQPAAARSAWHARREELLAQVAPGAAFGREVCRVEAEELALSQRFRAAADASGRPEAAAEFKLLIVSPAARGLGVGGGLVSRGEDHLAQTGATGYYLITDDT